MPIDSGEILATALSTVLLLFAALLGLALRYVREHLVDPVRETHKQVTVNHHSSEVPTVLDRIDDVAQQLAANAKHLAENTRETRGNADEIRALGRMFDGHLEQAEETRRTMQDDVDLIFNALKLQRKDAP